MVDKLPENSKFNNRFPFKGVILDPLANDKRQVVKQLPGVLQTSTMQKFYSGTMDHLFQPGKSKPINGYVGQRPSYWDPKQDYYLEESTAARSFYQLEPSMTSKPAGDDEIQSMLTYDDLINQLRFQGGLVNNHHRLFEQNYYTWCPPIDLDKFLNFREYFWMPEGSPLVEIYGLRTRFVADGKPKNFTPAHAFTGPEDLTVLVDGTAVQFEILAGRVKIRNFTPVKDSIVDIFVRSRFAQDIKNVAQARKDYGIEFTSGMRVKILNDIESETQGNTYVLENLGADALLVEDNEPDLTLNPDYLVMARGCRDGNPWSRANRWFHKDTVGKITDAVKAAQAKRPIIEFQRDLELYGYGTARRGAVHLVSDDIIDFIPTVNGKTSINKAIDGIVVTADWILENIPGGKLRVLVTGDRNPAVNNKVYQITVRGDVLNATVIADGADVDGAPTYGEVITVKQGRVYGNRDLFWDGSTWGFTQIKRSENQAPLFQLYDYRGVALNDAGVYPGGNFKGSRIFGYKPDTTESRRPDPVLGFALEHSDDGEIKFENFLATEQYSYKFLNGEVLPITSYYFHKCSESDTLGNNWYRVDGNSRQMVVDTFVAQKGGRKFTLSQEPQGELIVKRNQKELQEGTHYIRMNNQILVTDLTDGDLIEARSFNPANKDINSPGHYEVPLNLVANPGFEEVSIITRGEIYDHFVQIMRNQPDFKGVEYSTNNWRDTAQLRNLGSGVVQHSAPLLRTMLLAANKSLDFPAAARFVEAEYARFRAKFDQKIHEFMLLGKFTIQDSVDAWIDSALEELSRGYTQQFPFYHSGVGATDTRPEGNFIPATPSYLGVYPCFKPELVEGQYIQGHDGSRIPLYGDYRDEAVLGLEHRIYNSIPENIRNAERPLFDTEQYVSGKWRVADYSREEYQAILHPVFERWCSTNGVDYKSNTTFDVNDPFTWNWSSVRDTSNRVIPGHWRAIYRMYFDTDRPHTHPWEMLGFTAKPDWWDLRYGTAPYTRDNDILWDDIRDGRIAEGPRATEHDARWARPDIRAFMPVDHQGNLLNPYEAGIVTLMPTPANARKDWAWGDMGPGETAWRRSYWYPFAVALAGYLMKPARFIEGAWDSQNSQTILQGTLGEQTINRYSGKRQRYSEQSVHGEQLDDGTTYRAVGVQQWISDFLFSQSKDITEHFGKLVRGLDVQLVYKVGGFTDRDSLFVVSDSFDRMPSEDVKLELYKSPSLKEEFYGGVVVEYTGSAFRVYGFDIIDPAFKIIPADRNGNSVPVDAGVRKAKAIPSWSPATYYTQNAVVRWNDEFYRCIRTHTSASSFEPGYWLKVARPQLADPHVVEWFVDALNANYTERVPYGSFIRTPQEMSDFLSSYERYLVSRGWIFDTLIDQDSNVSNWRAACKDFMAWVYGEEELKVGDFIALSPASRFVKYKSQHGAVQPIEQIINGVYSILDRDGQPIAPQYTNVLRQDDVVTINPTGNQEIFATRLYVSEIEHVIVLNNTTIFQDIVYSPLLNIRQPRMRLQGFRTHGWKGRVDAPGFLVSDNKLIPNFEKSADDFRHFFDIEGVENSTLKQRARENVGYREKEYLSNLMLTPTNQFEFYQGMIQQKGTGSAFKRILRSNFIRHNDGIQFLEEWAFRLGDFGAARIRPSMDIQLRQKDFQSNPQLIRFNSVQSDIKALESQTILYSINGIGQVNVLDQGDAYKTTPSIKVSAKEGTGAKLAAIMDWSQSVVQNIVVKAGGSGFIEGDLLTVEGNGDGAVAYASEVNYSMSEIDRLILNIPEGKTSVGSGYAVGDKFTIVGGNGRAKGEVTEVDTNGGIMAIKLASNGRGYNPGLIDFNFANANNSAVAYLEVTVTGGSLRSVQMLSSGAGYDDKNSVRFTGNGRDAVCVVEISGGKLGSVAIIEPGSGYTEAPKLTVSGGNTKKVAKLEAIVDTTPAPAEISLRDFGATKLALLQNIVVEILVPFNGTQPTLAVGGLSNNGRYVDYINLGGKNSFVVKLTDDIRRVLNEDDEVIAYLSNISTQGCFRLTLNYSYQPEYFASQVADSPNDNIMDVTDVFAKDSGEFLHKDNRWVWRHDTVTPEWPTRKWGSKEKGNLPNAGYVHLDDVSWTTRNWDEFLKFYRAKQNTAPSGYVSHSVDIAYQENATDYLQPKRAIVVPNLSKGVYRLRKFTVNVSQGFPAMNGAKPVISVGTASEPEKYIAKSAIDITKMQNVDVFVDEYILQDDTRDSTIYVYYTQGTNLSVAIGQLGVNAEVEVLGKSVLPGDRLWCYDTGAGDWTVQRHGDTGFRITNTYPGSYYGQGSVVALDKSIAAHMQPQSDEEIEQRLQRIVLDGVEDVLPNLQGTYKVKVKNSRKMFLDANMLSNTEGNYTSQIALMDLKANTGVQIDKITLALVRPFNAPMGRNPRLTIGTHADPERFVGGTSNITVGSRIAITRPVFDYGKTITVDIADPNFNVLEGDEAVIKLVRSGNIFATPTSFRVIDGGSGYAPDSDPKVTVIGPTGVTAKATIVGTIVGYAVVDGGTGYTEPPQVSVVGGGGTGAKAEILPTGLEDGSITFVGIPGGASSTGGDYTSMPRVIVSGGNGRGAQIEPVMRWSVGSIRITNWGKCSWPGGTSQVIVEAPYGGTAPTVELVTTPARLSDTTAVVEYWETGSSVKQSKTVKFQAPAAGLVGDSFWYQEIKLPTGTINRDTTYEYVIKSVTNSVSSTPVDIGPVSKGTFRVLNHADTGNDFNLVSPVTNPKTIVVSDTNKVITEDDELIAYYNPDGVVDGLVTIVVDYHYTQAFELYDSELGFAAYSTDTGRGGNVLAWNTVRFTNSDDLVLRSNTPVGGWKSGDRVLLDDGRTHQERARQWTKDTKFLYHDLARYNGVIYRTCVGGSGAQASLILDKGVIKSVNLTSKGTLYTREPQVTVTGGAGAELQAELAPTRVYRVRVLNGGKGYKGTENLEIVSKIPGKGEGAYARITRVQNGAIKEVSIVVPGSGYTQAPTVRVKDDNNTDKAVFQAIMEPAELARVNVVKGGATYGANSVVGFETIAPSVPFDATEWERAFEAETGWRVYEFRNNDWVELRRESTKVESPRLDSAEIYNKTTNEVEQTLQLWDPYKGVIPGIVSREIAYMLEYDPAVYTFGVEDRHVLDDNQAWGKDRVGQLWWDLSTIRYVDYEIGDDEYKWKNWGRIAPGATVDVYEWTRSTTAPEGWADLVRFEATRSGNGDYKPTGTVKDINKGHAWVQRYEYNAEIGRSELVYYFWVKSAATLPPNVSRNITAQQVANIIQDPTNSDIPWFAAIDTNKVIVGGVKQYLNDEDTVLKIKWRLGVSDGNHHKQWILMREGDERNTIDARLWNKMRDSLVGWDANTTKRLVKTTVRANYDSKDPKLVLADASGLTPWGEVLINGKYIAYSWIHNNTLHGVLGANENIIEGMEVTQDQNFADPKVVPGEWLSETEMYGTLSRPRQTWFRVDTDAYGRKRPSREARKTFVDVLNNIFAREPILDTRYEWRDIFRTGEALPATTEYHYTAPDLFYRNQLAVFGRVKPGQRVLVESLDESRGFWTIWTYQPDQPDADEGGYVLTRAQRWRLQENELWEAADWYAEGWGPDDFPVRRFPDRAARDAAGKIDITLLKGTLVRVDRQDDNDSRWGWSIYTENGWQEVAKGASTVRLKDAFWKEDAPLYGFGNYRLADIAKRDGSWELVQLANALRDALLTPVERNEVFFSMVYAAQAQHAFVDWAFKTSFLYLAGYKEELGQSPIAYKDQIGNLISYIEEVKPYHVKLREFVRRLGVGSNGTEVFLANITDFDKPLYWDNLMNRGKGGWRKLDMNNPADQLILKTDKRFREYWNNYQKTNTSLKGYDEEWNPVRRPKVNILLDRVACNSVVGWDPKEIPWDASEERFIGETYVPSFNKLADEFRKYPTQMTEWDSYYADYNVIKITAPVFHDVGAPNDPRDDIYRADFPRALFGVTWKTGDLVVIENPRDPGAVLSVWRALVDWDGDKTDARYAKEYLPFFNTYWQVFKHRSITVQYVEGLDELARENQQAVTKGLPALIQTGDLVTVSSQKLNFIWNGTGYVQFWSTMWDDSWAGGLADRVDQFYNPEIGQKHKDLAELISGCNFRGTVLDGHTMEYGLWDMFPWDFEGGWGNEFAYYVGRDLDVNDDSAFLEKHKFALHKLEVNWQLDEMPRTQQDGQEAVREYLRIPPDAMIKFNDEYPLDKHLELNEGFINRFYRTIIKDEYGQWQNDPSDQRGLFYVLDPFGNRVEEDGKFVVQIAQSLADNSDIHIEGNEFMQPWFDGGHPDELVKMRVQAPVIMTVYQEPDAREEGVAQPSAVRIFNSATDNLEAAYLEAGVVRLDAPVGPFDRELQINGKLAGFNQDGDFEHVLHDPNNPSDWVFQNLNPALLWRVPGMKGDNPTIGTEYSIEWTEDELIGMFSSMSTEITWYEEKFGAEAARKMRLDEATRVLSRVYEMFRPGSAVWFKIIDRSKVVTGMTDEEIAAEPIRKLNGKMHGRIKPWQPELKQKTVTRKDGTTYQYWAVDIMFQIDRVVEQPDPAADNETRDWAVTLEYHVRKPGVMWVGNERVEYYSIVPNLKLLSDEIKAKLPVELVDISQDVEGKTQYAWKEAATYLLHLIPQNVMDEIDHWVLRNVKRGSLGTSYARTVGAKANTPVHDLDTPVYDVSVKHQLPMPAKNGLVDADTAKKTIARRKHWNKMLRTARPGPTK